MWSRRINGIRWLGWLAVAGCVGGGAYEATSAPSMADRAPTLQMDVDERAKEITVVMGPFVPHVGPGGHDDHGSGDSRGLSPLMRFEWPVDGWLRGFTV